jgi:peptidoglycan/LPS O-acetylase OafA/YrhL
MKRFRASSDTPYTLLTGRVRHHPLHPPEDRLASVPYRASIDGMRSIAVLGVLLFHWDRRLLPGGFVGVDVFFVISGYLITSIIRSDCEAGKFSLADFYQRRISRIFPVFLTVMLATLVVASLLYSSRDLSSAGLLAAASAMSLANLKLMAQGNYFEVSPDSQPFLHYWSLSVEEQFYLTFPPLLWIAHRRRLSRRRLLWGLSLVAIASFLACIALTLFRPTWAFYLLPTRAWELLAGAILAVIAAANVPRPNRGWLKLLGLLMIALSMAMIDETQTFPGYRAAFPVLGAVLLIGTAHHPGQITERLLSHPWLVAVGKLSYSLYLWHWPIHCFVDYSLYAQPAWTRLALKIALTLAFSIASYVVVERPARRYLNQPRKRQLAFGSLAAGVTLFSAAGLHIEREHWVNATAATVAGGGVAFTAGPAAPSVVLMGDSQGSMYGKLLRDLSQEQRFNLNVLSSAGGNPLPGSALYDDTLAFLAKRKPDVTIFAAEWAAKLNDDNKQTLVTAIQEVLRQSTHVILITQPPTLPYDASRRALRRDGVHPIFEEPDSAARRHSINAFLRSLQSDRIHVIDIDPLLVTSTGEMRFCDEHGRQLYQDRTHLSGYGADLVKEPLGEKLRVLLQERM